MVRSRMGLEYPGKYSFESDEKDTKVRDVFCLQQGTADGHAEECLVEPVIVGLCDKTWHISFVAVLLKTVSKPP